MASNEHDLGVIEAKKEILKEGYTLDAAPETHGYEADAYGYIKDKEGKMGLYDYDIRYESDSLKRHWPDAVILNDVSFDEAMNIWRGHFDA